MEDVPWLIKVELIAELSINTVVGVSISACYEEVTSLFLSSYRLHPD